MDRDNLIKKIREIFDKGDVEYSVHCQKRMLERNILRLDIKNCILAGEIIEDYPLDPNNTSAESLPSCLVLGIRISDKQMIHVVVGYNDEKLLIISAYYPDDIHWMPDGKTRRK